jgi:hypothetical protein
VRGREFPGAPDSLRGVPGAIAAFLGIILPGTTILLAFGILYVSGSARAPRASWWLGKLERLVGTTTDRSIMLLIVMMFAHRLLVRSGSALASHELLFG